MANELISIDEEWFVNNYIGQCAQLCPVDILQLFDDVSSFVKLHNAVSEIVRWRLNTALNDLRRELFLSEYTITLDVTQNSVTARSCVYWMNELTKIDKRLSVYFSAVALLHVALKITSRPNGFTDTLLHILSPIAKRDLLQSCSDFSLGITEMNTSELVGLLQKSAIEYLQHIVTCCREILVLRPQLSQPSLRRRTRTNVATISGV